MSRIVELTARYGSDRALGISIAPESGVSLLPNGRRACSCSDCAYFIRSLEPNTAIYGFWSQDNPTWAGAHLQDGHDFAVVDGRYIVDPWIVETEALSKRAVFDLENPADAREIARLYGNCLKWTLVEDASPVRERHRAAHTWSDAPRVITEARFALSEFGGGGPRQASRR